jgi:hypothetical protein
MTFTWATRGIGRNCRKDPASRAVPYPLGPDKFITILGKASPSFLVAARVGRNSCG